MAPTTWATMYGIRSFAGNRPPATRPADTAGLKWPPEIGPTAYAIVSTVKPKASATPTKPMPRFGNAAASTALPQPPITSQNVPKNSAPKRLPMLIALSPGFGGTAFDETIWMKRLWARPLLRGRRFGWRCWLLLGSRSTRRHVLRMFLEPDHRAAHAVVSAWMIVEDDFLERAWRQFAISAEAHRRHRETVWLLRGVEAERIGLRFGLTHDRIVERRRQQEKQREDGNCERQRSGIGASLQTESRTPARQRPVHRAMHDPERKRDHKREIDRQPQPVIEDVMAHLMAHHGLDLRQRTLV